MPVDGATIPSVNCQRKWFYLYTVFPCSFFNRRNFWWWHLMTLGLILNVSLHIKTCHSQSLTYTFFYLYRAHVSVDKIYKALRGSLQEWDVQPINQDVMTYAEVTRVFCQLSEEYLEHNEHLLFKYLKILNKQNAIFFFWNSRRFISSQSWSDLLNARLL